VDTFGGTQNIVKHKFPGGQITTQTFGAFPPDVIKWKGQFFQDSAIPGDMYDRINALQQMRVAAATVTLTVGQFSYLVLLHQIRFSMKLEFWIPYEIELIPVMDLNASAQPTASGSASGQASGTVTGAIASSGTTSTGGTSGGAPVPGGNATNGGAAVPSGTPQPGNPGGTLQGSAATQQAANLSQSNFQLNALVTNAGSFGQIPDEVLSSLTDFQQSLNSAIQQSLQGGIALTGSALQNLDEQLVQAQGVLQATINQNATELANTPVTRIAVVGGVALPTIDQLGQAVLAGQNAFAQQAATIVGQIANQIEQPPAQQTVLKGLVNPNLNNLALEYLTNGQNWTAIAAANPQYNITSPNLVGTFDLTIPSM
jgi:hypothetical protein